MKTVTIAEGIYTQNGGAHPKNGEKGNAVRVSQAHASEKTG
jgi:hypothetical protein